MYDAVVVGAGPAGAAAAKALCEAGRRVLLVERFRLIEHWHNQLRHIDQKVVGAGEAVFWRGSTVGCLLCSGGKPGDDLYR